MAPNVLSLSRVVKNVNDQSLDRLKLTVRTEYVVRNLFEYLIKSEYKLPSVEPKNTKEEIVLNSFKEVVDVFTQNFSSQMSQLSASLDVNPANTSGVLLGVTNELFCEGINWSKITTFFVFVSEFTMLCLRNNFSESVVEEILETALKYVEDVLEKWILDHRGWEGIIEFSKNYRRSVPSESSNSSASYSNWAKNAFYGTVRVLGTLANIAMLGDPVAAFSYKSF